MTEDRAAKALRRDLTRSIDGRTPAHPDGVEP
jgi:hypothetical protein